VSPLSVAETLVFVSTTSRACLLLRATSGLVRLCGKCVVVSSICAPRSGGRRDNPAAQGAVNEEDQRLKRRASSTRTALRRVHARSHNLGQFVNGFARLVTLRDDAVECPSALSWATEGNIGVNDNDLRLIRLALRVKDRGGRPDPPHRAPRRASGGEHFLHGQLSGSKRRSASRSGTEQIHAVGLKLVVRNDAAMEMPVHVIQRARTLAAECRARGECVKCALPPD